MVISLERMCMLVLALKEKGRERRRKEEKEGERGRKEEKRAGRDIEISRNACLFRMRQTERQSQPKDKENV